MKTGELDEQGEAAGQRVHADGSGRFTSPRATAPATSPPTSSPRWGSDPARPGQQPLGRGSRPPDRDSARADCPAGATTRQPRFGLTTELVTVLPYDLPRRWAHACHLAGFAAIRHDPRAHPSGVSLFGPAGPGRHPGGDTAPSTRRDFDRVRVTILDVPPAGALTIL